MASSGQNFGKHLKDLRLAAGFRTAGELAIRTGLDTSTLWRLETDQTAPRPDTLSRLAEPLGVSKFNLFVAAGFLEPEAAEGPAGYDDDIIDLRELPRQDRQKVRDFFNFLKLNAG